MLHTWAIPEVSSKMVNDWNILTNMSVSKSSHLLPELQFSSMTAIAAKRQRGKSLSNGLLIGVKSRPLIKFIVEQSQNPEFEMEDFH